jgi:hypothetical protein
MENTVLHHKLFLVGLNSFTFVCDRKAVKDKRTEMKARKGFSDALSAVNNLPLNSAVDILLMIAVQRLSQS